MSGNLQLTGKNAVRAENMLYRICRLLDKKNIPYVVDAGTLLGIVREGRLLPWDNDVDIVVFDDDVPKVLKLKWRWFLYGYYFRIRRNKNTGPMVPVNAIRILRIKIRKLYFFPSEGLMDIFVKRKIDDKYYWVEGNKKQVLKSAPADFYEQRTRINFKGYDYAVPKDYEAYLSHRYGDWKTVVKDYDFLTDDKAIVT